MTNAAAEKARGGGARAKLRHYRVSSTMDPNHGAFHEFGTGAAMQGKNLEGGMPTLNHRLGAFPHTNKVDAVAVREQDESV